ncbi:hypothetical protein P8452_30022 [Trifolium repens]|nr:hypothetical protein P8452_30022 [Trifolium repens]
MDDSSKLNHIRKRKKEKLQPRFLIGVPHAPLRLFIGLFFELFDFELVRVVEEDQEANLPKEIADYLNKMGARIPNVKPGKATIEYLSKVLAFTQFWGGLLLSVLATTSSVLYHYLRRTNAGFTSFLIIISQRQDLEAANITLRKS